LRVADLGFCSVAGADVCTNRWFVGCGGGPPTFDVHLVLDNASTHRTPAVKRWLTNHPRFVLHFTPTSSSWLTLVERWFSELTTKK
jgi:hypothetical protein